MESADRRTKFEAKTFRWVGPLLILMASLLVAFQYTTLEKFACLPPGVGLLPVSDWVTFIHGRVFLTWSDAILPTAMSAVFFCLIGLEFKGRMSVPAG
tara:strand:- start:154 stop:447 length:294 start_codon:yes stop_codon:yes gene_type:complete